MKKVVVYFLIICFSNLLNPLSYCIAEEKLNLKIEKKNNISALIEKNTKKEILPYKYTKIRKAKYDKKTLYIAQTPDYITLYSPDGLYDDFLENYYQSNKYNSNIKFKNYPSRAIIRYKKDKKFGLILAERDRLHITKPVYEKIVFPDEKSIAARILNISFAPEDMVIVYSTYVKGKYTAQNFKQILDFDRNYYNNKILPQSAKISENITINDNIITVKYDNFAFNRGKIFANNDKTKYFTDIYTPLEYYNVINSTGKYNFENYPLDLTVKDGYHLYVYNNTLKYEITLPCSDFYIEESLLKTLSNEEIALNNGENIIAKNGLWGIINKNNEIKVPFAFDEIYPLSSNYIEEFYCKEDALNCQESIIYIPVEQKQELFLVRRGLAWGIINSQNEFVIPLENQKTYNNDDFLKLKTEINKKISYDYEQNEKEKYNVPLFILDLILLPIWLILPACVGVQAHIHYR